MRIVLDGALVLGVAAVAPLGAAVHPQLAATGLAPLALPAGAVAALGVLLGPGVTGVLLLTPLAAWTAAAAVHCLRATVRSPSWVDAARTVGLGYLAVAGVWLAAHLLALEPAGVGPPFVALTAIHFIYAGFAATLIAAGVRDLAADRLPLVTAVGVVATVAGPPLVAAGFQLGNALQVAGALVLTAGLYAVAGALLTTSARGRTPRPAGTLLTVAALAVVAPMLLAVHWAAGTTFGFAVLSVPAMARTHGVVNALGFTLPALVGLRLLTRPQARRPATPDCPTPGPAAPWSP